MRYILYFVLFISQAAAGFQSSQDSLLLISGKVVDEASPWNRLEDLMIVNLATQQGNFGKADGSFFLSIHRTDTLLIASSGYEFKRICFADSTPSQVYRVTIPLRRLYVQLKEIHVFSPRDLESIEKDIQKLGYKKSDYEISGINAIESPITFLYEEFSKREKLKRHNAELVNIEKRRILLKELLTRFVADEIIDLSNDEFDRFIDFSNVSEEFMKTSTQYEFMVFIKYKYSQYTRKTDYYREK